MSNKKKEALPVKRYRFHFETIQNDAILYYERLLTWNILYSNAFKFTHYISLCLKDFLIVL